MAFGHSLDIVDTRLNQIQSENAYSVGPVGEAVFTSIDPPVARAIYAIFEVTLVKLLMLKPVSSDPSSLSRDISLFHPPHSFLSCSCQNTGYIPQPQDRGVASLGTSTWGRCGSRSSRQHPTYDGRSRAQGRRRDGRERDERRGVPIPPGWDGDIGHNSSLGKSISFVLQARRAIAISCSFTPFTRYLPVPAIPLLSG